MARLERWLVVLIALHSYGIGGFLLFFPQEAARFAGWGPVSPLFFASQAGIFHVVLATAYLVEYFRYGGVLVLVTAKAIAVVFLFAALFVVSMPWAVPFCGATDGLMGLAVLWVHGKAAKQVKSEK